MKDQHLDARHSLKVAMDMNELNEFHPRHLLGTGWEGRIIDMSKLQRQRRGRSARICDNSDLPSEREIVSTESYLLSSVVGRPDLSAAGFRPGLLRPASLTSRAGVRTAPLGTYSVMSERGLRS